MGEKNNNGMAEFKGTVKAQVGFLREQVTGLVEGQEELKKSIDDSHDKISCQIKDSHTEMFNKLTNYIDEHAKYHRENEHRWGIPKVLRNNLVKLILGTSLLAIIVFSLITTGTIDKWVQHYISKFIP